MSCQPTMSTLPPCMGSQNMPSIVCWRRVLKNQKFRSASFVLLRRLIGRSREDFQPLAVDLARRGPALIAELGRAPSPRKVPACNGSGRDHRDRPVGGQCKSQRRLPGHRDPNRRSGKPATPQPPRSSFLLGEKTKRNANGLRGLILRRQKLSLAIQRINQYPADAGYRQNEELATPHVGGVYDSIPAASSTPRKRCPKRRTASEYKRR